MKEPQRTYLRHGLLFVITLITTTLAGAEWMYGRFLFMGEHSLTMDQILQGLAFSLPFLGILTVHEFGHFFTAKWHHVKTTLPNYIPLWLGFLGMPSIGTIGAVIRIKDRIFSRKVYFDIGISGPIAGFIVALGVLYYGFTHLPPPEYIFEIHPEYQEYGLDYADHVYQDDQVKVALGTSLLFEFFKNYVATDPSLVPNPYEIIHYPWLFAGFLSLFFTALNLIPIGQLDGGHVLYGLIGRKWHPKVSIILFTGFIFYAGLGILSPYQPADDLVWYIPFYLGFLYLVFSSVFESKWNNLLLAVAVFSGQFLLALMIPGIKGFEGWLVFGLLLGKVLGVYHPPVYFDHPLDKKRRILGWIALGIFILCFSPAPLIVEGP